MKRLSNYTKSVFAVSFCLLLYGCAAPEQQDDLAVDEQETAVVEEPERAAATFMNASGESIGTVNFQDDEALFGEYGVHLDIIANSLPPGEHGFHIHEGARCEAPDFESAGDHFNPENAMHGGDPAHAGDMSNLEVADDGTVNESRDADQLTVHSGLHSIVGRTVVIHAEPDDYETQPSGNAGARIACGEIERVF